MLVYNKQFIIQYAPYEQNIKVSNKVFS